MTPTDNRRTCYRVVYPTMARPEIRWAAGGGPSGTAAGTTAPVLDCSEEGLRFEMGPEHGRPRVDAVVIGNLQFRDGRELRVCGTVIGVEEGCVRVRLHPPGVPAAILFREQRFLMAHYPGWR